MPSFQCLNPLFRWNRVKLYFVSFLKCSEPLLSWHTDFSGFREHSLWACRMQGAIKGPPTYAASWTSNHLGQRMPK